MKKYREAIIVLVVLIPLLMLWNHWGHIPDEVALHWNAKGEVDGRGSKDRLIFLAFILNVPLYVIMLLVPKIDPKKKMDYESLYSLRVLLHLFMSALAFLIIRSSVHPETHGIQSMFSLIGTFFAVLGYFFTKIKHNYFIGIRTPWTLENEVIWKKTHQLASWFWMVGGVLIVLLDFVVAKEHIQYYFLSIIGIMTIIPVGYSFLLFKKGVS